MGIQQGKRRARIGPRGAAVGLLTTALAALACAPKAALAGGPIGGPGGGGPGEGGGGLPSNPGYASATSCPSATTCTSNYVSRSLAYSTATGKFTGTITGNQCPTTGSSMGSPS